jgi:hypothetical protein
MHGSEPYDAFLTDELLGIVENGQKELPVVKWISTWVVYR